MSGGETDNRVLLVRPPPYPGDVPDALSWTNLNSYPLGLACLSGMAKHDGMDVRIHDMFKNNSLSDLLQVLHRLRPSIVGVGCTTTYHLRQYQTIIRYISDNSEATIVAGGPHATFRPEDIISAGADYVVVGEGEITFRALCRSIAQSADPRRLSGIAFTSNGKLVKTRRRPLVRDLDRLPFPDFEGANASKYQFNDIETSRGCPDCCIFCSEASFWRRVWRPKSAKRVVEEMSELERTHGATAIRFVDDSFGVDESRVLRICDRIRREKIRVTWYCQTRVRDVNLRALRAMRMSGCSSVFFGIEVGYDDGLRRIGKHFTKDEAIRAIENSRKAGIDEIGAGFIIGFPWETLEQMKSTLQFAVELRRDFDVRSNIHFLKPYPGAPILGEMRRMKLLQRDLECHEYSLPYPAMGSKYVSKQEMQELLWDYLSTLTKD